MANSNTPILHRWFHEVWNSKDKIAIDRLMHSSAIIVDIATRETYVGSQYIKKKFDELQKKYSAIKFIVHEGISGIDIEAAKCTIVVVLDGDEHQADFTALIKIEDGKIVLTSNDADLKIARVIDEKLLVV
ncbi:MAG TPA: nuclear transport factor 2 family protein [Chitinophagaceae bacterium]|jgi:hypothetical protein